MNYCQYEYYSTDSTQVDSIELDNSMTCPSFGRLDSVLLSLAQRSHLCLQHCHEQALRAASARMGLCSRPFPCSTISCESWIDVVNLTK